MSLTFCKLKRMKFSPYIVFLKITLTKRLSNNYIYKYSTSCKISPLFHILTYTTFTSSPFLIKIVQYSWLCRRLWITFCSEQLPFDSSSRFSTTVKQHFKVTADLRNGTFVTNGLWDVQHVACSSSCWDKSSASQMGQDLRAPAAPHLGRRARGQSGDVPQAWDAYDSHRIGADVRFSENSD